MQTIPELEKLYESKVLKEALTPKGIETVRSWVEQLGARPAAIKIVDHFLNKTIGLSSSDLSDSPTFMNGLDTIEEYLNGQDYQAAATAAKETAMEMLEDEGMSDDMG